MDHEELQCVAITLSNRLDAALILIAELCRALGIDGERVSELRGQEHERFSKAFGGPVPSELLAKKFGFAGEFGGAFDQVDRLRVKLDCQYEAEIMKLGGREAIRSGPQLGLGIETTATRKVLSDV